VAGGQRAATEILGQDRGITGLIAYNDLMAIGAMRAIRAAGLRIPADVSVVGFDDVDLAAYVDPPLTTIAQATSEMGHWAVTRLAAELVERASIRADPPPDSTPGTSAERVPVHVVLPVRLEIRGSTGPARPIGSA
jgi:DNA-binding LacI/PurR family transcriptional regulator